MRLDKQNIFIYSLFLSITLIGIIYGNVIKSSYSGLRIWQLENILILCLAIPFLFLQKMAGLPNFFDNYNSNKVRLLQPILIGAIFGILDIIVIKIIQHPQPYSELPPFLQPFPYSLFLYFSGALEIEVFYRLIPITIILIIGNKLADGKYQSYFIWIALIATSIREPLEQFPTGEIWFMIYAFLSGFLMNYIQASYYLKAGFLSSLTLRLGHYLFWHIILGIYVQYVEIVK